MLEKSSKKRLHVSVLVEKLDALGGIGPAKVCEERIKTRLGWHTKATSAVRHMLTGARKISPEEGAEIEAAYLRYCADKIEAHREEDRLLFQTIRTAIETLERSDPDFHRPQIQAMREVADRLGNLARNQGNGN